MKRSPRERLEAQIRFQKEANFVMLRNWVGQSTSDDFYDLCDRYGLMMWDEFFEANPQRRPGGHRRCPLSRQRPRKSPPLPQSSQHRPLVRTQRKRPGPAAAGRGHFQHHEGVGAVAHLPRQLR